MDVFLIGDKGAGVDKIGEKDAVEVVGFVLDDMGDKVFHDFVLRCASLIKIFNTNAFETRDGGHQRFTVGVTSSALATFPHRHFLAKSFGDFGINADFIERFEIGPGRRRLDGNEADCFRSTDLVGTQPNSESFLKTSIF